ncbi:hypothetical protein PHYPSEUDO_002259 [Phytophthora pseudosyringae]|uniref:Uncharacterized protein n=1 Tax=Phytophthora pseudosyringae TaxID=221518 RepID=A0A8T1VXV8_9STRA|nr:hypothetical protein PHYPSEUDO_002259 [Phytophthora pseudosyringae]
MLTVPLWKGTEPLSEGLVQTLCGDSSGAAVDLHRHIVSPPSSASTGLCRKYSGYVYVYCVGSLTVVKTEIHREFCSARRFQRSISDLLCCDEDKLLLGRSRTHYSL